MSETILTRDLSSGRIHRRIRAGHELLTSEGCNLDDAGAYTVLTREEGARALENAEPWSLCERCFPDVGTEE